MKVGAYFCQHSLIFIDARQDKCVSWTLSNARLIFVGKVKKRDMLAVNNEIIQLLCTFELGQ